MTLSLTEHHNTGITTPRHGEQQSLVFDHLTSPPRTILPAQMNQSLGERMPQASHVLQSVGKLTAA